MMDRRPIWAMPAWVPERVAEALPEGWELTVIDEETDGSGDGAGRVSARVLAAVEDARVYLGYGIPAELLRRSPGLEWVHSGAAGVGSSLTPEMKASEVVFTNSAGVHAPPIAETVLAMILFFGRGLDIALANQRESRWSSEDYYLAGAPLEELSTSTVGIVGLGGIGREVTRRVASLGARVVALKRTPLAGANLEVTPVGGTGDLSGLVEVVHGRLGFERLLSESDVLVLAAPETDATRGMLDADALSRLRDGALVINVARGRLVVEGDLIAELQRGRIRGAGLDVFCSEPLAEGHPFWSLPNVLVTPHVSAVTRGFWTRETDLILRNLRRYVAGDPIGAWENVVDMAAGY
jgi:phosphoglycerate dehydrogenase-like enzyme